VPDGGQGVCCVGECLCALFMSTSCQTRLPPKHYQEPAAEPDNDFDRKSVRGQTLATAPSAKGYQICMFVLRSSSSGSDACLDKSW